MSLLMLLFKTIPSKITIHPEAVKPLKLLTDECFEANTNHDLLAYLGLFGNYSGVPLYIDYEGDKNVVIAHYHIMEDIEDE